MIKTHGINLTGRGLRGESQADILRRTGRYGVLPTDSDNEVMGKLNAAAEAAAATAEAASGPNYPDTASGLAATEDGEGFAVDNGDGTVTIWLNDGGTAVEQRTLATTDYLASPTGAAGVGVKNGAAARTVKDALSDFTTVKDEGAEGDGVTDDTAAFALAVENAGLALTTAGDFVVTAVDTELVGGSGNLKSYADAPRVTPPELRKNKAIANRPRQPFEDEFAAHAEAGGTNLYYSAFSSGIMLEGSELYVCRTGYEHASNHSYPSVLQLFRFRKDEIPAWSKTTIYTTTTNEDIRDVNISPHPKRAGFALISFAEHLSGGTYQARLIVWNERTQTVESNRILGGITAFKWGNALVTPADYLLITTYDLDGTTIRVWRSTSTLGSGTGAVTMAQVSSLTDTFASEPTMGYWQDKLTLFYRRTGAVSRVTYSYDKEGNGPWAPTAFPYGASAHCPAVLAYSDAPVWTAFFGLGTDRTRNGAASTTDLRRFKGTLLAPSTGNVTSGYPAIVDCGGYYATLVYSEHHDKAGDLKRTRIDRIEVDKGRVDIAPQDLEYTQIIELPVASPAAGFWRGTPYGATSLYTGTGANYSFGVELRAPATVSGAALTLSGSATVSLEIYDGASLVATSNSVALSATDPTATVFTFPSPPALTAGKEYKIKLIANAACPIYDIRHNNRKATILRSYGLDVVGAYNAAGTSITSTSLVPVALKVQP